MIRTIICLRLGVLAGSVLMVLPVVAQQTNEPTPDIEAELRELQVNRIAVLEHLASLSLASYQVGRIPLDRVLAAQHDLLRARLETSDQRNKGLEWHAEIAKKTVQVAQEQYQKRFRRSSVSDPLRAAAVLLKIEMEAAESVNERIAVLESHVEIAKQTMQMAQELYKAQEVEFCDRLQVQAAIYAIEIELLRERAKAKPTPK